MQLPVSLPWSWHDVMLAWLIPPWWDEPSSPLSPLWKNIRSELDPNKRAISLIVKSPHYSISNTFCSVIFKNYKAASVLIISKRKAVVIIWVWQAQRNIHGGKICCVAPPTSKRCLCHTGRADLLHTG